jgi:hypothetical protein
MLCLTLGVTILVITRLVGYSIWSAICVALCIKIYVQPRKDVSDPGSQEFL